MTLNLQKKKKKKRKKRNQSEKTELFVSRFFLFLFKRKKKKQSEKSELFVSRFFFSLTYCQTYCAYSVYLPIAGHAMIFIYVHVEPEHSGYSIICIYT